MKKVTLFLMALFLLTGLAYARDYEITKKAGDYNVVVKIDRNPPVAGNNNFDIGVKDGTGKDVTDAKVLVNYSMPAMPGMPAMSYKADAPLKGTSYKAKVNLSMAGSWNMEVRITRQDKTTSAKFTVDAK